MLSDQSKQNIEHAFHSALRKTLVFRPSDSVCIGPPHTGKYDELLGKQITLVTISAFTFRLLTIFCLAEDAATRSYFCNGTAGGQLTEIFAEFANLCCGTLNRELTQSVPHLAMSIPYALSSHCFPFLSQLKPQYLSSYGITINDVVHLQATLCMCCTAPVVIAPSDPDVVDGDGALEMF